MTPKQIKIVNRSTPCAQALFCFIPNGKRAIKKEWVKTRELYEADTNQGKRIVTPVTILGDELKTIYMMDALTGSLYDIVTGRCLTSSEVRMDDFVMRKNLIDKLLAMKTEAPV